MSTPIPHSRARLGFVLVIVLAMLGVLAFLALELVQKSQVARNLSLGQMHKTKATLAARSGLDKVLTSARSDGYLNDNQLPFARRVSAEGEDSNRNGNLDPGEDLNANGLIDLMTGSDRMPCPSMAVPGNPAALFPVAHSIKIDGVDRGYSWSDDRNNPQAVCHLEVKVGGLDINAGVTSGLGTSGKAYETDAGLAYSASDLNHPFNLPMRLLLNAWGNVWKYRYMVRPDKTYDWSLPIDAHRNSPDFSNAVLPYTTDRFDIFYPSERCMAHGDIPLGDRVIGERPPQGYTDLNRVIEIVGEYVKSWCDDAGRPAYPLGTWERLQMGGSGQPIDLVSDFDVKHIQDIMAVEAVLNPVRIPSQHYRRVPVDSSQTNSTAPHTLLTTPFDTNEFRAHLNTRIYPVEELPLDINRSSEEMLAALFHSVGGIEVKIYRPHEVNPHLGNTWATPFVPPLGATNYFASCVNENAFGALNFASTSPTTHRLLSLTESLKLAKDIVTRRRAQPFHSFSDVSGFIRRWRGTYDGRDSMGPRNISDDASCKYFQDNFFGWERVNLLSHILNPHLNSNNFIFDEALPRGLTNKALSIGINGLEGSTIKGDRPYHHRFIFDKFDPHFTGGHLATTGSSYSIISLGWSLDPQRQIQGRARIRTLVEPFEVLHIHSQKDWNTACPDLGNTWISYPEAPQEPGAEATGPAPSSWDGQLALKPLPGAGKTVPWGDPATQTIRIPLHAYDPAHHPTRNAASALVDDVWPQGRRAILESMDGELSNKLINSLVPPPILADIPSVLPGNYTQIDAASDLMPGGGIRVSPWHNSGLLPNNPSYMPNSSDTRNDRLRKEAVLVLRNAKVDQTVDDACPSTSPPGLPISPTKPSMALPDFKQGVVSFYFKPAMTPPNPDTPHHVQGRTLFYAPFVIEDQEVETRIASVAALTPLYGATSAQRKWFSGHLRLVWGTLHNAYYNQSNFNEFLLCYNQPVRIGSASTAVRWPMLQSLVSPGWPGFIQNGTTTYFLNMNGLTIGGATGNIPCNLTPGLFSTYSYPTLYPALSRSIGVATQGVDYSPAPFPNEMLLLECQINKLAHIPVGSGTFVGLGSTMPPLKNTSWDNTWGILHGPSALAASCSYFNGAATPLHLFDTRDPARADFHNVRKVFIIGPPVDITTTMGDSFRDANGFHQPLVVPGRWNHFLIAWRNMWKLLNNTTASHKGGCLAVWINGTYRRSVQNKQIGGMFVMQDTSLVYRTPTTSPANNNMKGWWETPTLNTNDPQQTGTMAPNIYTSTEFLAKTWSIPFSVQSMGVLTGASMIRLSGSVPIPHPGEVGFESTPNGHLRIYDVCSNFGFHKMMAPDVWKSLPPRLYFGCQPHCLPNINLGNTPYFFPTGIAWGAFMDIQVFGAPASSIIPSPGDDGSFRTDLANFNAYSPYSGSADLDIEPLRALRSPKTRVMAVRLSAYLPEFSHFWDERNPLVAGPDSADCQTLKWSIEWKGIHQKELVLSQNPSITPELSWSAPFKLDTLSTSDFVLAMNFLAPEPVFSTPIVETLEMIHTPNEPLFRSYQID